MKCPHCEHEIMMDDEMEDMEGMDMEESDDSDMKKAILDELMGMGNEERKKQLPKKGSASVSIEMMKMAPKRK